MEIHKGGKGIINNYRLIHVKMLFFFLTKKIKEIFCFPSSFIAFFSVSQKLKGSYIKL